MAHMKILIDRARLEGRLENFKNNNPEDEFVVETIEGAISQLDSEMEAIGKEQEQLEKLQQRVEDYQEEKPDENSTQQSPSRKEEKGPQSPFPFPFGSA